MDSICLKSICASVGAGHCLCSATRSQTSNVTSPPSARQFPRMVPGRRTVHGGVVQDRRVTTATTAATNGPSTMADGQAGGRTLLDKLTSKFSAKR